ncbi:MAG: MATE family efflux transporter, partial [Treponema sp.]|nr:MATE family efflux transporter [Treponema sp.]
GYARSYFRIILYSSVFGLVSFGLSHCTRAQGFPLITMIALLIGAVLNIAFDALFILAFGWGVEGAGWATVAAQGVSMLWILRFVASSKAGVRLRLRAFRLSPAITAQIMSFGSAQFLYNITLSAVQVLFNASMVRYGAAALGVANGGDIALAGMNIIGGIQLLILMPIFGINQGAQPLLGYNYGAKKFSRVLRAYALAVAAGSAICLAGFAAVMLFPTQLVRMFVSDADPALLAFAPRAMRIMLMMLPFGAFSVISTIFFVVTGRPKVSIFLSLLRQCLILTPLILILGRTFGLWGVVFATPISDALVLLITGAMMFLELRKLKGATA